MATASGTPLHPIISDILRNPRKYDFVQALRILEKFNLVDPPCIFQTRDQEQISAPYSARFITQNNLTFPASIISKGVIHNHRFLAFTISTFGLIGPIGTLPFSYSTIVSTEIQKKNSSLKSFIDIFQNRSVSLFYGASTKYRLVFSHERRNKSNGDEFRISIDSINGFNSKNLQNRLDVDDEIIAYFAGFFSSQKRNATGLENILNEVLGIPVCFCPFRGHWIHIPDNDRSSLTNGALAEAHNKLGVDSIAGSKVWSAQNSFKLYIGPVKIDDFVKLLPGNRFFLAINSIVAVYCGSQFRFEINILLEQSSVPSARINNSENIREASRLGRNTWLLSQESPVDRDDAVFICD